MPKYDYLSVAMKSSTDAHELFEKVREALAKMSTTSVKAAAALAMAHRERLSYPFGTIMRYPGDSVSRPATAMVVGDSSFENYIQVMILGGDREGTIQDIPLSVWELEP